VQELTSVAALAEDFAEEQTVAVAVLAAAVAEGRVKSTLVPRDATMSLILSFVEGSVGVVLR
jgi:hypothetical protein